MNFDGEIHQGLDAIQASEEAFWAAFPDAMLTFGLPSMLAVTMNPETSVWQTLVRS